MSLPGFAAGAGLYRAASHYRAGRTVVRPSAAGRVVTPAFPCACTDPNCQNPITTCTCDCQPDRCAHCLRLPTPCARARCECICNGGDPTPGPGPCGFLCT
jgi:hypothetical protein